MTNWPGLASKVDKKTHLKNNLFEYFRVYVLVVGVFEQDNKIHIKCF